MNRTARSSDSRPRRCRNLRATSWISSSRRPSTCELSGTQSIDAPLIQLWLPGLTLIYDDGYPPSGLVELDAFLAKILDDLSQCRPTVQITPDYDCEPLAHYPE